MSLTDRGRTERYRERMRAAGLRPLQMWVPDTGRPGFGRRLHKQIELLRDQPEEIEALDFIEALYDEDARH